MKGQTVLPHVIDALTESIRKFGVTRDEQRFDDELDFIISKMKNLDHSDSECEWEKLQNIYSKLKYLDEMINFYNLPNEGKFIESLKVFMESMDLITIYFLENINWDDSEEYLDLKPLHIKECFDECLQIYDPIHKIKKSLYGYKMLIKLVEHYRNEKSKTILEPEFLEQFQKPLKKRQKLN